MPVSENVLERNTRMWSTKTGAVSEPPKSPSSTRVLASGSMERERSDRVRKVPEADDAARAPVSAAAHAAESRSESSAPLSSLASDICDTAFGPRSALVVVVWVVVCRVSQARRNHFLESRISLRFELNSCQTASVGKEGGSRGLSALASGPMALFFFLFLLSLFHPGHVHAHNWIVSKQSPWISVISPRRALPARGNSVVE